MTDNQIENNFIETIKLAKNFIEDLENLEKVKFSAQIMTNCIKKKAKIISCGNGGSMTDAMHFAEELTGRFGKDRPSIPAVAISDSGYISCVANDYGYESVFSRFIEAFGQENDVLLAISTSGNSPNVLKAAKTAKNNRIKVIGLTGNDGGKLATLCDIEIRVPHFGYADRIQEIHIQIIHSLVQQIENSLFFK